MIISWNKNELNMLSKIGLPFDVKKELSDEEFLAIEDKVSDYLQVHGFDKNYQPLPESLVCEGIMDKLGQY